MDRRSDMSLPFDTSALVDAGVELSIVGSFSRAGIAVRRRLFHWATLPDGALDGRTVLVTGPTSGLGRAATDALAALGARVILVGRNEDRLAAVRDALVAIHGEDRFPIVVADMGSLGSVRGAVGRVLETESRLDVLIDNAGAIYPERIDGPDGIEATLVTLVVGPFALVSGLMPLLQRTEGSRVIAVTSGGMYFQGVDFDDLQSTSSRTPARGPTPEPSAMQVALVREWARRLGPSGLDSGIAVNAMHPAGPTRPGWPRRCPIPSPDGSTPPEPVRRHRHPRLAGGRDGTAVSGAAGCSSIADFDRSTGSRTPGSRLTIVAGSGTSSWRCPGRPIHRPALRIGEPT